MESLELRAQPAAPVTTVPAIALVSSTTGDSQGVTVSYEVDDPAAAGRTVEIGIYRSDDDHFDADDLLIGSTTVTLVGPGLQTVTIPLEGGLSLNPQRPYVLAVADPDAALDSGDPGAVTSFRTYTIGVVTHGGLQDKGWKNGPAWQLVMAKTLLEQGYDAVLPFNWVAQSSTPGASVRQVPRLINQLLQMVDQVPDDQVVDLHFIGHSQGTVLNSMAARFIEGQMPENLRAGYVKMTMLDPHAANTAISGQQYSVSNGLLGAIAKGVIDNYQSKAKDPPVIVPDYVDEAEVFYQHTRATGGRIYNLWGQVPVHGDASYFDLTGGGVVHSGKTGVYAWYQNNIIPLLGDGAPEVRERILDGEFEGFEPGDSPRSRRPTYAGTAYPGATVRLYAGPAASPGKRAKVGEATVDAEGNWSLTARSLFPGYYRFIAVAVPPRQPPIDERLAMVPTTPLGSLVVTARA